MGQVDWSELLFKQLKQEARRPKDVDWWQRASVMASIFSSVVIAGAGILVTWSVQQSQLAITKGQLAITQGQLEATRIKNADDLRHAESKLAVDLIAELCSENPTHRAVAIALLSNRPQVC